MHRILAIGHANVDIYLRVDKLPEPDSREVATELYIWPGGAALNYAVMASELGCEVYLAACVGEDLLGELVLSYLRNRRVRLDLLRRVSESSTGVVVVLVDRSGVKYMIAHTGANLRLRVTRQDIVKVSPDLVYIVLAEHNLLEQIMHELREVQVSVSLGLRPQIAALGLDYLMRLCSILGRPFRQVFLNKPEALYLTRTSSVDEAIARLSETTGELAEEVVITLGEEGSVVLTRDQRVRVEAYRLGPVVDTTGAGDIYAATYTVARLSELDVDLAARLASLVAALKVMRRGGSNIPSLEEIKKYARDLGLEHTLEKIAHSTSSS